MRIVISAAIGVGGFYLIQHFGLNGLPLEILASVLGGLFVYQTMSN